MTKKKVKKTRVSKKRATKTFNPTVALPLEKYGTEDDPCFGKLHSPTAEECRVCGDCELCSIITSQVMNTKRTAIEAKKNFKDIEVLPLDRDKQIGLKKYMESKIAKGYSKVKVKRLCLKRYPELTEPEIKKLNRLLKSKFNNNE